MLGPCSYFSVVETLVPGGPYMLKYVDIGGTNFGGSPYVST